MSKKHTQISQWTLSSDRIKVEERVLVLADLHQQAAPSLLEDWLALEPSVVLIVGDFIEHDERKRGEQQTLQLMAEMSLRVPVFYALGNHEIGCKGRRAPVGECPASSVVTDDRVKRIIKELSDRGVFVLHNEFVRYHDLCIGALSSAAGGMIATDWLFDMEQQPSYRLLMCHHPEYYARYVKHRAPDLTVSGHAHGGQWRFFGQGIYAPGQGLLPRLTNGFYEDGKLLVSRGLADRWNVPRLGNPKQTILLHLKPCEQKNRTDKEWK